MFFTASPHTSTRISYWSLFIHPILSLSCFTQTRTPTGVLYKSNHITLNIITVDDSHPVKSLTLTPTHCTAAHTSQTTHALSPTTLTILGAGVFATPSILAASRYPLPPLPLHDHYLLPVPYFTLVRHKNTSVSGVLDIQLMENGMCFTMHGDTLVSSAGVSEGVSEGAGKARRARRPTRRVGKTSESGETSESGKTSESGAAGGERVLCSLLRTRPLPPHPPRCVCAPYPNPSRSSK